MSIDSRLKTLEKQAKDKRQRGQYCTKHARPPVILFDKDNPPKIPDTCPQCGKLYPPDNHQEILDLTKFGVNDNWG